MERSLLSSIHHPPSPTVSYVTKINSERNDTSSVVKPLLACIMRNNLMDYLLLHADNLSGDSMSLTWRTLAMMHASEIQSELRHKGFFEMLSFLLSITMLITWELPQRIDASMQTHRNYVWSLAGTPWILQCIRLTLAALSYVLIQEFVGDPMLPTAPLCPFFLLRFAHSQSSLRVFFSVKSSSL